MNARQKAKKYKKLYNNLLHSTMPYNIITLKYDTLMVKESFPQELLANGMMDDKLVEEKISTELTRAIMPYVTLRSDFEPINGRYTVYATIRVAKY